MREKRCLSKGDCVWVVSNKLPDFEPRKCQVTKVGRMYFFLSGLPRATAKFEINTWEQGGVDNCVFEVYNSKEDWIDIQQARKYHKKLQHYIGTIDPQFSSSQYKEALKALGILNLNKYSEEVYPRKLSHQKNRAEVRGAKLIIKRVVDDLRAKGISCKRCCSSKTPPGFGFCDDCILNEQPTKRIRVWWKED